MILSPVVSIKTETALILSNLFVKSNSHPIAVGIFPHCCGDYSPL